MASCGFQGNSDIYGIGIRIGYYTQAVAVWFSNFFLFREAKVLRAVNKLFLLALMIAGFIYFVHARETHVIEAFLMLQVGIIIALVGITERSRYSSKYIKTSRERLVLRIFIVTAGSLFNVCFWWWGVEVMLPTPCNETDMTRVRRLLEPQVPGHGTYIFYILKTNIYGWAGTLMRIKSLIAAVWTAPKIVTFDVVVLMYDWRMRKTRAAFVNAMNERQPKGGFSHIPEEETRQTRNLEVLGEDQTQHHLEAVDLQLSISSSSNRDVLLSDEKQEFQKNSESLVVLKGVANSSQYLEDLLSIYPETTNTLSKKKPVRFCGGLIQFNIPHHENQCTDTSTPYTYCLWRTFKTQFSNKPSIDLRWRLALHMAASGQHPAWRWPRLVHRMHQLSQAVEPPDWRHVAVASDILLTQIPFVITSRTWMFMAAYQFCIVGALIVQVETAIAFNHMGGLNSLSTLGQLIPFILGVGGLIKVIWGKWCLLREGVKEERESEEESEYEKAMALYLERRRLGAGRSIARAVTA
ncbi:MAG: hypothetical protein ASARMPREDX12_000256 [Alectoria sarmentosa]|nr:MAG: hypothetical protein ASARMPREDX12_000256 [Alectoria sarmentosa]